ncbi:MAG: hypothetical protein KGP14_13070 [Betaproteobacteria bacterium]|nr:hypothetical protein [Betaproteobacteria bacterium]
MQIVKFPDDYYDEGEIKFAKGSFHPLTSETQSLVNTGFAELVDTDNVNDIDAIEAVARLARERADACAAWAAQLDEEAKAAEALVESASKAAKKKAKEAAKVQTPAPAGDAVQTETTQPPADA